MSKLFGKEKVSIFAAFLLLAIVVLSYGKTVHMFYWIDDWGMLFNMIHPDIFPGNFGHPAYRYNTTPFVFLYPFVGFNSQVYFGLGVIQYWIATVLLFFFVRSITKSFMIALISAAIFGSGYIGSYAMYRISNSYQLVDTAIFMILTVWTLFLFYKTKKIKFYILSLILFTLTLEFLFLRSQALLPLVVAISLFAGFVKINFGGLKFIALRLLPFGLLYYFFYFKDARIRPGGGSASSDAFHQTFTTLFSERNFELFNNLIVSIINSVFPQKIISSLYIYLTKLPAFNSIESFLWVLPILLLTLIVAAVWFTTRRNSPLHFTILLVNVAAAFFVLWSSGQTYPLWNPNRIEIFTTGMGFASIEFLVWLYFLFRRKEPHAAALLLLGLIWVFSVVVVYFVYSPHTSLDSTSRYVIPGFVGTALVYGSLIYLLTLSLNLNKFQKSAVSLFLAGIMSFVLVGASREDQQQIVSTISYPSRLAFTTLVKEVQGAKQNAVFYFETVDDPVLKGNILGGMPHVAVAIAAGLEDGATIADSYDHLFYLIKSGKTELEDVYTFFASHGSFINTSNEFRAQLVEKKPQLVLKDSSFIASTTTVALKEGMAGVNPIVEVINIDYPSFTPIEVVIKMSAQPLPPTTLRFPYYDYTGRGYTITEFKALKNLQPDTAKRFSETDIINTLLAQKEKQNFYKNVAVKTTTEGKQTEAINLIDGNLDTNWAAYDANWNNEERPQDIILDLGFVTSLQKLFWVNHYAPATPTRYSIYYSDDLINWTEAVKIEKGNKIESREVVSENIKNIKARYIKFSIYDTYAGLGHPPAIDEIWVASNESDVDIETQSKILQCVYCFMENFEQATKVNNLLSGIAKAKISWTTDAKDVFHANYSIDFPIDLNSKEHVYTIYIPAKGTKLKKIKIDNFPLPLSINIKEITIKLLTLDELAKKGLLKNFGKE